MVTHQHNKDLFVRGEMVVDKMMEKIFYEVRETVRWVRNKYQAVLGSLDDYWDHRYIINAYWVQLGVLLLDHLLLTHPIFYFPFLKAGHLAFYLRWAFTSVCAELPQPAHGQYFEETLESCNLLNNPDSRRPGDRDMQRVRIWKSEEVV